VSGRRRRHEPVDDRVVPVCLEQDQDDRDHDQPDVIRLTSSRRGRGSWRPCRPPSPRGRSTRRPNAGRPPRCPRRASPSRGALPAARPCRVPAAFVPAVWDLLRCWFRFLVAAAFFAAAERSAFVCGIAYLLIRGSRNAPPEAPTSNRDNRTNAIVPNRAPRGSAAGIAPGNREAAIPPAGMGPALQRPGRSSPLWMRAQRPRARPRRGTRSLGPARCCPLAGRLSSPGSAPAGRSG
jgi:hypothetical protein